MGRCSSGTDAKEMDQWICHLEVCLMQSNVRPLGEEPQAGPALEPESACVTLNLASSK